MALNTEKIEEWGGMLLRAGIIVIGIMLMAAGAAVHCYSEDSSEANMAITMQGNVTAIDWVGSVLEVNDIEFSVPSNVKVKKGIGTIGFPDINVGDSVTVTYSKEKDGTLKASRVIVAYSGDVPT
jgi:hypothetical protein